MSKYDQLWKFVQASGAPMLKLSFDQVQAAAGIPIDHAFLTFKKELLAYGYEVGKISLKEKTVIFHQRVDNSEKSLT